MTNLTLQEKVALEEVFLCFQAEKWYIRKFDDFRSLTHKALRFYHKNRSALRKKMYFKRFH